MSQEPLTAMIEDSAKVSNGPIESRLHAFRYGPRRTNRGGDDETETAVYNLQGKAAEVLDRKGDAPKIVHARGVAHLLIAATARQNDQIDISAERKEAIASLVDAATREPKNAAYQSDVAAALLVTGDPKNRDLAIIYLDKALAIDPRLPEALFNRGLALQDRDPKQAIAAFQQYLRVDPSSPWATEAKSNIELLQDTP